MNDRICDDLSPRNNFKVLLWQGGFYVNRNNVQNPADNIYCNFVTKEILSMQTKEEHIGPKLRDSMIVRGRPSVLTEDDSNLVHLIK